MDGQVDDEQVDGLWKDEWMNRLMDHERMDGWMDTINLTM